MICFFKSFLEYLCGSGSVDWPPGHKTKSCLLISNPNSTSKALILPLLNHQISTIESQFITFSRVPGVLEQKKKKKSKKTVKVGGLTWIVPFPLILSPISRLNCPLASIWPYHEFRPFNRVTYVSASNGPASFSGSSVNKCVINIISDVQCAKYTDLLVALSLVSAATMPEKQKKTNSVHNQFMN